MLSRREDNTYEVIYNNTSLSRVKRTIWSIIYKLLDKKHTLEEMVER